MGLQRVGHDLATKWQQGGAECGGGGWELSTASFPFSENLSHWLGHCELPPENTSDFKSRLLQNTLFFLTCLQSGQICAQGWRRSFIPGPAEKPVKPVNLEVCLCVKIWYI